MDPDDTDAASVAVGRPDGGRITFSRPVTQEVGSGYVQVPIRVEAPGLDVTCAIELEQWGGGTVGLIDFFAELAASWRGWTGAKGWYDDGATVSMTATLDGTGAVILRIIATPTVAWEMPGRWKVEALVEMENQSLEATATAIRRLLRG